MKKFIVFLITVVSLFVVPKAWAQTNSGEHIRTYDVDSVVRTDGSVSITERIQYVFVEPRHGIIRKVPYVKTNSEGKRFRLTIDGISVADENNHPYEVSASRDGTYLSLRVGDPNVTITGAHWYVISYAVRGAITYFSDHDELYWNDVGDEWTVPIQFARVTVSLPQAAADADIKTDCFTGVQGSTDRFCTAAVQNHIVAVQTTRALGVGEGMTTVIGFPKGIVAVLEPAEFVPFFSTFWGKVTLLVLGVIALLWYIVAPIWLVRRWWVAGRDPKPAMGEVAAWFSPPKTQKLRPLTPAETGALIDETVDMRDLYASIVDLARRGYIKIIETKKNEFDLVKQKSWLGDPDTLVFERKLLGGIFGEKDRVTLKDVDLRETVSEVSGMLYTSLVTDGFFPKNPQTIRTLYIVLAVLSVISFNPVLFLIAITFGLHMPRKTLFGSEQAAVARSLKNFLVSQDEKLAFQAKHKMLFEKLLPYAVAFGVEVIWAKRFADIALTAPDWYVSSTPGRFNSVIFAQSIGNGYSKSFAVAGSYKSSSGFSSGFSGGGFSGGGGGGGGGGSW